VTIVSPSWAAEMKRRFSIGQKLHVISNGYDLEELIHVKPHHFGHFAIVYTGTFYPPKRVIDPVMTALKRLKETGGGGAVGDWHFHYYGPHQKHFIDAAKSCGLVERVVVHGLVSHAEALAAVRGAGAAIVITSVLEEATLADKGIVTGKVFETLGLKTPAFLIAPFGSDVERVIETAGLGRVFTGTDIDGMASFLIDVMRGQAPEPKKPQVYAWENIIGEFDTVLRGALEKAAATDELWQ
jgi:glycosyltransferase involved in cell wall biosynthesis